jgi:hypothetical protein
LKSKAPVEFQADVLTCITEWRGHDADCKRIDVSSSGVTDDDVVALAEMMKAGHFGGVKALVLVSISCCGWFCI